MHEHMIADFRRRFWISLALTVPVLALSPTFASLLGVPLLSAMRGARWVSLVFATTIYVIGDAPFLRGMAGELRKRQPGMMTLVAVATTTSFAYSVAVVFGFPGTVFFWELATLIDVMLLGHWIEMRSIAGASNALQALAKLVPSDAHLLEDGKLTDVPTAKLVAGDLVRVLPGERVPADGIVRQGSTSMDESLLTGESVPVEKGPEDKVIGGSVNAEGSVDVEVTATGESSFVAQVVRLVQEAQASRSRTQMLADRAAAVLTFVALGAALVTFLAWTFAPSGGAQIAIQRAVTVMVIACPHALGLAVPLVVAMSTSMAAAAGVLIRDRSAFEAARNVDTVIFDKTGTLTTGEFRVNATLALSPYSEADVLRIAAAVESHSEHPVARGILAALEDRDMPTATGFRALPGSGASAVVDGHDVLVASPAYIETSGFALPDTPEMSAFLSGNGTVGCVIIDQRLAGLVALGDTPRPEARQAVDLLSSHGISTAMVTGDRETAARSVADAVGIPEIYARVAPQGKAERVNELRRSGRTVAMVGDGVNDAPALAAADLGVAIGAGTDVAMETASVVLVSDDPRRVWTVIQLSRLTHRKMLQNLAWAAGYNVIAIPLAAGVLVSAGISLSPAGGAALMSLSTVAVAINARLMKVPTDA